jgi:flavin reductase (DIM6/NTAB) family NADH-FMN oxidoreductase RutF/DNA-binding IclR family transcriptional regulator
LAAPVAAFDPRELRGVLGSFVTGVTVVTTLDAQGQPHGVTANSFSSVSLDPPLVQWSQACSARSHPAYRDADRYAVNILALDQMALSQRFSRSGEDKFAGVATRPGLGGVPLLEGCCAHIECRKVAMLPGGDHVIFLGQVEAISRHDGRPLVFGGGRYMMAFAHDTAEAQQAGTPSRIHVNAVRLANAWLPEAARALDAMVGLGVWGNHGPTLVGWEPGRAPVAEDLRVGTVVSPLHSATGLALTAFLPAPITAEAVAAEVAAQSSGGNPADVQAEVATRLREVRQRGWARSRPGQFVPGVAAASAPVYDRSGEVVFALTAVGEAPRFESDGALESGLLKEAARLSERLGTPV